MLTDRGMEYLRFEMAITALGIAKCHPLSALILGFDWQHAPPLAITCLIFVRAAMSIVTSSTTHAPHWENEMWQSSSWWLFWSLPLETHRQQLWWQECWPVPTTTMSLLPFWGCPVMTYSFCPLLLLLVDFFKDQLIHWYYTFSIRRQRKIWLRDRSKLILKTAAEKGAPELGWGSPSICTKIPLLSLNTVHLCY